MPSADDEPQLELPLPLPARQSSRLAPALLLLLGLIGGHQAYRESSLPA